MIKAFTFWANGLHPKGFRCITFVLKKLIHQKCRNGPLGLASAFTMYQYVSILTYFDLQRFWYILIHLWKRYLPSPPWRKVDFTIFPCISFWYTFLIHSKNRLLAWHSKRSLKFLKIVMQFIFKKHLLTKNLKYDILLSYAKNSNFEPKLHIRLDYVNQNYSLLILSNDLVTYIVTIFVTTMKTWKRLISIPYSHFPKNRYEIKRYLIL